MNTNIKNKKNKKAVTVCFFCIKADFLAMITEKHREQGEINHVCFSRKRQSIKLQSRKSYV